MDLPNNPNHKTFQSQFEQAAKLTGWKCYHTHNSRNSPSGFPDEVCVRGERIIFAELKVPPDKVRGDQQEWLDLLAKVPCNEVYVWTPADWGEIVEVIR